MEQKFYAVILAGGTGTRFGGELPKQFIDLGGKPVIIHTIEKFICFLQFETILVCVPEVWISYMEDLLFKYNLSTHNIKVIAGGSDRNTTILNSIKHVEGIESKLSNVILVTHDAVRPFVSYNIIKNNLLMSESNVVVDTVVPATDTIVHSKDGNYIDTVPNRSELYQGQTPQTFNAELFKKYISENQLDLSDAVGLFTAYGHQAKIVIGDYSNIKITTKFDLIVANSLINS